MPKVASEKEALSLLPTDVGSRIGVMFNPIGPNIANMHFIINGEDQGPCSRNIPFQNGSIYAVVDVYGSTKKIRTVQVYGGKAVYLK
jgi:neuralized-like protein 2